MADERVAMKVSSFHAVLPFAATSATRPVLVVEKRTWRTKSYQLPACRSCRHSSRSELPPL